jgi:peptidoglycan/xylan/chitin deacetylase (PgdA/CDA1 family)
MPRHKIVDLAFLTLLALMVIMEMMMDLHWAMYVGVVVAYIAISACGATVMSLQYFVPVKWRAQSTNAIAITFDDGPIEGKTTRILDILERHKVPGTFFCIGSRIKGNEQLMQRIDRGGHLIGNHSFFHGKTFDLMSAESVIEELKNTDLRVAETIGKKPKFFRPPYGVTNPMIAKAVRKLDYTVIGWSVRSFDTITKDPARLLKRLTSGLKGGDVILFHDYCESTHAILSEFIDRAQQKGFRIIRLDELLNEQPYR